MNKLMKIPSYISYIGILISFALFLISVYTAKPDLALPGAILFLVSGWLLAAKFFLCSLGFFSTILDTK